MNKFSSLLCILSNIHPKYWEKQLVQLPEKVYEHECDEESGNKREIFGNVEKKNGGGAISISKNLSNKETKNYFL